MWGDVDQVTYRRFRDEARVFWHSHLAAGGADQQVVADVSHPDPRMLLRVLTVANAVRRLHPARLVLLSPGDGPPPRADALAALAEAYAADEIVDVGARTACQVTAFAARAAGGGALPAEVGTLTPYVDAGYRRHVRAPLSARLRATAGYQLAALRARARTAVYDDVFAARRLVALVTADVTDDVAGVAARAARRAHAPVVAVVPRGGLRAYCLFPGADPAAGFAEALAPRVAAFFASRVWARRAELTAAAERTAWRARRGLDRPAGRPADALELANGVQRRQVRAHAAARWGLDADRPTVVVAHRPVTESPCGAAADPAEWFAATAAHARTRTEVNWLFLDHPAQEDRTGTVAALAAAHADAPHLRFVPGAAVGRNAMVGLADLAVVPHGRLAPALAGWGVPVLAAAVAPWSGCGFVLPDTGGAPYPERLHAAVADLAAGRLAADGARVARARLWRWLADAGADIVSGLVPPWDLWPAEHLLRAVTVHLRQVEPDGEPVFAAVERAFTHRLPLLTRADLPAGPAPGAAPHCREPAASPGPAGAGGGPVPAAHGPARDGPTRAGGGATAGGGLRGRAAVGE
ncbi:MAG TPA: hypothetical protein VFY17_02435 [Pilimelia sp.]|nr:hypothetical protein [Pilimelia sp.]